jgi:endoglucanase
MERPTTIANTSYPATDVGAEYAAALALSSRLLRREDPALATRCLQTAKAVYTWSWQYRGLLSAWFPDVRSICENHATFVIPV